MKKKNAVITISYLLTATLALAVLAGVWHEKAQTYKRAVASNYQHAFAELVTAMGEMDAALQKSLYATSPSMAGAVCTEVFGKAMTAQMSLGALPFSVQELERTSGFISRVGDYAYELSRSAARGQSYTGEQRDNLKQLSEDARMLSDSLKNLQTDMSAGVLTMDELTGSERSLDGAEDSTLPATIGGSMRLIEKEFPEIPSLIYDGPFSEHLSDVEPKMLAGLEKVDENAARDEAARFTGVSRARLISEGLTGGDIPCYRFSASVRGGKTYVTVSERGGAVVSMFTSRQAGEGGISVDDARKAAGRFLEEHGYENMRETYFMTQDNRVTINYAFEQNGVIMYPDLVKVSVALDSGTVCGFEAAGYLTCHTQREVPVPSVSEEQAGSLIAPDLKTLSHALVVIPSDGKYELLCHEFKCETEDGRKYLIYVNAVTGEQEKILILLEDDSGSLTL